MSWFESVLRIECYLVLLVPTLLSCMLLLLSLALKKSCGGGWDVNHYDHLQAEIEMHVMYGVGGIMQVSVYGKKCKG